MAKVLDKINSPADLKRLSVDETLQLADEIRDFLISTVSKTGGHLAPNLGVVELTIGLHLALDSPKDKIIWDVGHQSYVHKLLTERKDKLGTLRQYNGLSGFPKRSESEHDIFDTGHASTSISVALGLAEARDMRGTDETIVAVIGDGALTGGMAYEALDQAGHLKTHLIVILNDNEMSIASNVGAMSSYLGKIRLDPTYEKLKKEFEERVRRIPAIGEKMVVIGEHLRDSLKQLVVPGMIFEELGFKYLGPIDGHDIEQVRQNVNLAKRAKGPVLVHALTQKGRGYHPAETRPEKFHGTDPFIVENGESREDKDKKVPSYTQVFGETIVELARSNQRIIAITAAMPSGTGLTEFAKAFPDRFYDVGIAEQHAVTFAAGLAVYGFLPVVAIYSTFLERAYDQIIQDVALQGLKVVFAVDRAGLVGEDGPTHHGAFDLSYLRHIPGLVIMAPKDENELRHMLYTAIEVDGPVAIRYPRGSGIGVELSKEFNLLEMGKAEVLREGEDVLLIAVGRMVGRAVSAADLLEEKGISAKVINARFIKPLDEDLIVAASQSSLLVVTVEENTLVGGFGSGVIDLLSEKNITTPVMRLGLPDRFITHGSVDRLLVEVGLDPTHIADRICRKLKELGLASKARGTKKRRWSLISRY